MTLTGSPVTVWVGLNNDAAYEGAETFSLKAAYANGLQPVSGTATVIDNGTGTGGVDDDRRSLSVSSVSVNEGSPFAVFRVTGQASLTTSLALSGGTGQGEATIETDTGSGLEWHNETSRQWVPYSGAAGLALDADGSVLVRVKINNDTPRIYEGPERFSLMASYATGPPGTATGTGTILDDGTGHIYLRSNTTGLPNQPGDTGYPGRLDDDRGTFLTGTWCSEKITGTGGTDWMYGFLGRDTLIGGGGDDYLDGGGNQDVMIGGMGDDTYVVDHARDRLTEAAGAGRDRILTELTTLTLARNVEDLTYTGTGSFTGRGNAVANTIEGRAGNDSLNGLAGNDTLLGGNGNDRLFGGPGADMLTGGEGADRFVFARGDVGFGAFRDTVTDFMPGDLVDLSASMPISAVAEIRPSSIAAAPPFPEGQANFASIRAFFRATRTATAVPISRSFF